MTVPRTKVKKLELELELELELLQYFEGWQSSRTVLCSRYFIVLVWWG